MSKLYFMYGTMNSGKSIEILKTAHNYNEQQKPVILMTSSLDDRVGKGLVASRIGLKEKAQIIKPKTDLYNKLKKQLREKQYYAILIDECQFLTKEQVVDLTKIVDGFNIPVLAFGLKNDFQNNLFEGSEALLTYADKIQEIKTICYICDKKATMNLRLVDGVPVYYGEQIQIGGNESYVPVCRKHYNNFDKYPS